jgi:hypothetical protein
MFLNFQMLYLGIVEFYIFRFVFISISLGICMVSGRICDLIWEGLGYLGLLFSDI